MIAGAADQIVQAGALPAEDENAVAGEVELVVVGCASFVEADNPEILPLELFKSTNKIDDAGNAQMFGSSGAGFHGNGAERRGTALGQYNTIHSCSVGYAEKRAKILWVFHTIQSKQEPGFAGSGRRVGRKQVFNCKCLLPVDKCDDALVRDVLGGQGKLFARLLADTNAELAAECDELFEAAIVAFGSDKNVVKAATSGLESFFHRMQPVENFHEG
jgi:hypothetical protein